METLYYTGMSGWLIISSKQNFQITARQGFAWQGLKRKHVKKARLIVPGDLFFYYITGEKKLAAVLEVTSFHTQASDKIWVNLGKDPDEVYPWRFQMTPLAVLPESDWIPMVTFSTTLLHFRKWPPRYWQLGLQGQIHALRDEDTYTLRDCFP